MAEMPVSFTAGGSATRRWKGVIAAGHLFAMCWRRSLARLIVRVKAGKTYARLAA
ncbi:hypothetical protein KCP77_21260 [Salmonella enterica subsp. enterica]|nr:hypothetical protein KCP77_21260 [Salmonella enterica subsp. enterica]